MVIICVQQNWDWGVDQGGEFLGVALVNKKKFELFSDHSKNDSKLAYMQISIGVEPTPWQQSQLLNIWPRWPSKFLSLRQHFSNKNKNQISSRF